jgi:hypothetical protein
VPADFAVDLSRAGEYTGTVRQTRDASHGLCYELVCAPAFATHADARQALTGLQASLTVTRPDGASNTLAVTPEAFDVYRHGRGAYVGCAAASLTQASSAAFRDESHFAGLETCKVMLRVDAPAPALADRTQRLVAHYMVCRTETGFRWIFGGGALGVGVVFAVVAVCVARRGRKKDAAEISV